MASLLCSLFAVGLLFAPHLADANPLLKNRFAGKAFLRSGPLNTDDGAIPMPESVINNEKLFKTNHSKVSRSGGSEVVPTRLTLKMEVIYNTAFKEHIESNPKLGSSPEDVVRQVVKGANEIYGYKGLGTRLTIDLKGISFDDDPNAKWRAQSEWLNNVALHKHTTSPNIDHYAFFTKDQVEQLGTVGIAYLATVCVKRPDSLRYKMSINEIYSGVKEMSVTLAHELGHALALDHDFKIVKNDKGEGVAVDRKTKDNSKVCTGIDGVMDYNSKADKWSPCSKEDLQDFIMDQLESSEKFCLGYDEQDLTTVKTTSTTEAKPAPTGSSSPKPGPNCGITSAAVAEDVPINTNGGMTAASVPE